MSEKNRLIAVYNERGGGVVLGWEGSQIETETELMGINDVLDAIMENQDPFSGIKVWEGEIVYEKQNHPLDPVEYSSEFYGGWRDPRLDELLALVKKKGDLSIEFAKDIGHLADKMLDVLIEKSEEKGLSYRDMNLHDLIIMLQLEFEEFIDAKYHLSDSKIPEEKDNALSELESESIDISNFCMMIVHCIEKMRRLEQKWMKSKNSNGGNVATNSA